MNGGPRTEETSKDEEDSWFLQEDGEDDMETEDAEMHPVTTKDDQRDNPFCPVVKISKETIKEACRPWKKAIIVKLLGKRLGLQFFKNRLLKLWCPKGDMEMIDLDNDYFLLQFSDHTDMGKILENGPWMILGHYLIIQRWHPEFFPCEDELKRVAVWLRVPGLPIEYYDKHILWGIGNCLGKTVKIDSNTLRTKKDKDKEYCVSERGKFARLCVEIDIRKVLRSQFELNGRTYKVEYEGLNLVCFECGHYGHRREVCPLVTGGGDCQGASVAQEQHPQMLLPRKEVPEETFGPWMLVQQPLRQRKNYNSETYGHRKGANHRSRSNKAHVFGPCPRRVRRIWGLNGTGLLCLCLWKGQCKS